MNYPIGLAGTQSNPRSPLYEPTICIECGFDDDLNEDGICADCEVNDDE